MVSWPKPRNITELRGILGLTGYYRKFIRGYSLLAQPLTNFLKKRQFGWNIEAAAAFEQLKLAMTQTPVLSMPNFNDVFVIETDASSDGIEAVLLQNGKPIAYMSRVLGITKKDLVDICKRDVGSGRGGQILEALFIGAMICDTNRSKMLKISLGAEDSNS